MAQKNYKRDRRKYRATVISLTMSIGLFTAAGLFNMYLLETGAFVLEAPEMDLKYTLYADVNEREADVEHVLKRTEGIQAVSKHYRDSFYFAIPKDWAQTGLLSIYSQTLSAEGDTPETAPDDTVWIHANMLILNDADFRQFAREQKVEVSSYQDSGHVKALYLNTAINFNTDTERYEKETIFPEETDQLFEGGYLEYDDEGRAVSFHKTMEFELGDPVEQMPESFGEYTDGIFMILPECMYQKFYENFQTEFLSG